MSPSNGVAGGGGAGAANGRNYLEHEVTKMDTLAGVAIKYGVEVADIKRLNGLATDLQMFAMKTLRIPLPGRHPPSAAIPSEDSGSSRENGCKNSRSHRTTSNILDSLESLRLKPPLKVSPAMNTLQNYYGLDLRNKRSVEGMEMTVYRTGTPYIFDNGLPPKASPFPESSYKTRSLGFSQDGVADYGPLTDSGDDEGEKSSEKSVRRRQKAEPDLGVGTPEKLLKEENSGGRRSSFSTVTGKGLALRPKSASRTSLTGDVESSLLNAIPLGIGDSVMVDEPVGVRKTSSLSSLQDQDGRRSSSSSIWSTSNWNLKPDLPVLSAASITGPLLEGLPLAMSGRRNKAALD